METMKSRKIRYCMLVILTLSVIVFYNHSFARVFGNGSGGVYTDGKGESMMLETDGNSIESLIVDGAGFFIKANSKIQLLLYRVEMSDKNGVDFIELKEILNEASTDLKNAIAVYDMLISKAELTPYDPTALEKLLQFDFDLFLNANQLNESIFNEVKPFLRKGSITTLYKQISLKFKSISVLLESMKEDIAQNRLPLLDSLWQLNNITLHTQLFGQYISQVCYAVR